MPRYVYTWFVKSPDTQCDCLAVYSFQEIYSSWYEMTEDMKDCLNNAELEYKINETCTPEALRENDGEMVYATYEGGEYIVKILTLFD